MRLQDIVGGELLARQSLFQHMIFWVLASERILQRASPICKEARDAVLPKMRFVGPGLACVLKARVTPMLSK